MEGRARRWRTRPTRRRRATTRTARRIPTAAARRERQLLRRERSTEDKREVLLHLTEAGTDLLQQLSRAHRQHLSRVGPEMVAALSAILDGNGWDSRPESDPPAPPKLTKTASSRALGRPPGPAARGADENVSQPLQAPLPVR